MTGTPGARSPPLSPMRHGSRLLLVAPPSSCMVHSCLKAWDRPSTWGTRCGRSDPREVPIMAAGSEPTLQPYVADVREVLPRSASIIEAFRARTRSDFPRQRVLDTANELAAHHQRQWHAEDACRAPGVTSEDIAAGKRLIDELNARRVALVEQVDEWVASQIRSRADASLHTETFGSVVDRLAIAWVRANSLINANDARDRARVALRQLAELADAYDDLVRDVAAGQRRLPAWRPLKAYRSAS